MFDSLLSALAQHAHRIPESAVRGVFTVAADAAWLVHTSSVQQLERNLRHVVASSHSGQSPQPRELRRLSRIGMRSYFQYFAEAMTVAGRSESVLRARIRGTGDGLESLRRHTATDGKASSAPIAIGHQGNWDYAGFWAKYSVAPVVTVAEHLANEELLRTFVQIREHLGIRVLLAGSGHLTTRLESSMREDTPVVVPLLADRDLSRHGEFVDAFGSIIRVARGPAALAYDTGQPLYVVNMYRERLSGARRKAAHAKYGYVVDIHGPVDIEEFRSMPRDEAIHHISQAWVDVWAKGIAQHPCDWHMLQPIFLQDLDPSRLAHVPDNIADAIKSGR